MFDPSWNAGCRHCSFWADNFHDYAVQDPHAPEREGLTVFIKDSDGAIFRTYSAQARGSTW